jgi:hypothetical protein
MALELSMQQGLGTFISRSFAVSPAANMSIKAWSIWVEK